MISRITLVQRSYELRRAFVVIERYHCPEKCPFPPPRPRGSNAPDCAPSQCGDAPESVFALAEKRISPFAVCVIMVRHGQTERVGRQIGSLGNSPQTARTGRQRPGMTGDRSLPRKGVVPTMKAALTISAGLLLLFFASACTLFTSRMPAATATRSAPPAVILIQEEPAAPVSEAKSASTASQETGTPGPSSRRAENVAITGVALASANQEEARLAIDGDQETHWNANLFGMQWLTGVA